MAVMQGLIGPIAITDNVELSLDPNTHNRLVISNSQALTLGQQQLILKQVSPAGSAVIHCYIHRQDTMYA